MSGRSARLADGLSRNPPGRDDLLAQRTKDLQGLIGQLRGFSLEEFLGEEEPGRVIPWSLLSDVDAAVEPVDLITGKKMRPGSLVRSDQDPGAGGGTGEPASLAPLGSPVVVFSRIMAESGAMPVLRVLYVPDYCAEKDRLSKTVELSKLLTRSLPGFQARVSLEEPPFEDLEGLGLHFEKQGYQDASWQTPPVGVDLRLTWAAEQKKTRPWSGGVPETAGSAPSRRVWGVPPRVE